MERLNIATKRQCQRFDEKLFYRCPEQACESNEPRKIKGLGVTTY